MHKLKQDKELNLSPLHNSNGKMRKEANKTRKKRKKNKKKRKKRKKNKRQRKKRIKTWQALEVTDGELQLLELIL